MNWDSITYRQKNKFLLGGAVLLLLICYLFAFRNTIDLYQSNNAAEEKLEALKTAPQQIAALNKKLGFLNSRVKQYVRDDNFDQEDILVSISDFCKQNRLKIVEFPKSERKQKEDIVIETFHFTVEGNYVNLVKLIYDIEVVNKIGRIASLNFETQVDRRSKVKRLLVSVYLQNLRNNNE